jgi:histidinol phosphatase-like enzyme
MSNHIPVSKPWVAVDLDGTLCEDGHYPDFGKPVEDAKQMLNVLKDMGFNIMIWTNRASSRDLDGSLIDPSVQVTKIKEWCRINGIPCDYVPINEKPLYVYAFIDNKAHRYSEEEGGWWAITKRIQRDLIDRGIEVFGDKSPHIRELSR